MIKREGGGGGGRNRGPMSRQVWHDKAPTLLKGLRRQAKTFSFAAFLPAKVNLLSSMMENNEKKNRYYFHKISLWQQIAKKDIFKSNSL